MNYRTLGGTGLQVSMLGMGSGGHDPLGARSGRSEPEMIELLHHAYDLGINLFDTSPGYGDGRSERILGQAIREIGRENVVVSTKIALAGSMPGQPAILMRPQEVAPAVNASLERLQMDHVDIMLMAVADQPQNFGRVIEDLIPELVKLRDRGKIRFIGSSEQTRSDGTHVWLQRLLETDVPDVVMVGHNMLNQSAQRSILPTCVERNLGVINVYTVRNLFWDADHLREVIYDLVGRGIVSRDVDDRDPLGWLLEDGEVDSLVEAAYRFAAYTEGVSAVMCGTIRAHELDENVRTVQKGPLSGNKIDRLRRTFGRVAEPMGN